MDAATYPDVDALREKVTRLAIIADIMLDEIAELLETNL